MRMQQDYLQTNLTDKTETATHFLEEALSDFRKGRLQEAAEKMTVSGALVREMIGFVKREEMKGPSRVSAGATFRHRPERHVMWYEVKEKYLPEQVRRDCPPCQEEAAGELPETGSAEEARQELPLRQAGIEELELSVRSENCLHYAGIETIGQLAAQTQSELRQIRNFGQKCLAEVMAKMAEKGLSLREEENGEQSG